MYCHRIHLFRRDRQTVCRRVGKEFGENTYYLSDSFNEMELPIDKEDKEAKYKLLAEYGETIYKSIAAGNPDAVWRLHRDGHSDINIHSGIKNRLKPC